AAAARVVMDQTLRPVRTGAAAADAAVQGGNPLTAALHAAKTNKGPLYSDVLRHAGVPKWIAGPLGFGLDLGLDPTTYLSGGSSIVARAAARKAAADVIKLSERSAGKEAARVLRETGNPNAAKLTHDHVLEQGRHQAQRVA